MIRSPRLAALATSFAATLTAFAAPPATIAPATMARIATVDPRFQSYNIEMLEVTGGRFWAPYKKQNTTPASAPSPTRPSSPAGMDPSLYSYRQPIDLANPRLRKLAAALGPTYLRVSGTWANSTFFEDTGAPAPATPPSGFNGVLTRQQWKGVVEFSHAVDAEIVTSLAISPGVRDTSGVWTPSQAQKFLDYTRSLGGHIAAAEMFNEPTFASMGGAPTGYDAAAYGRDFHAFRAFVKQHAPDMLILGPGSVGEGAPLGEMSSLHMLRTEDMLKAEGPGLDVFSYHFYGGVSKRCAQLGASSQTTSDSALSSSWLSRTERDEAFYAGLRDRFEPGKPIWLTETGETACGGNPWASTFIDSFRYLNQLGTLARRGVQVVIHNTLAASDYALLDESTLMPRPNYWSAILWRRLMGTTVLDPGPSPSTDVHLYAQCTPNRPGAVTLLAINADRTTPTTLNLPTATERYTLSASDVLGSTVQLNGAPLAADTQGNLPSLTGTSTHAGDASLSPATISFFVFPNANNEACH